ncbi:MAG: hypothetical protein R3C03_09445 [Pirellulaceae bacterium]
MRREPEIRLTSLPRELWRETMYDWGRRGIRSRNGFRFRGSNGRMRCFFDPTWMREFTVIPARAGHEKQLREIARQTPEWIAVAKKRGAYWPVAYYLVPIERG